MFIGVDRCPGFDVVEDLPLQGGGSRAVNRHGLESSAYSFIPKIAVFLTGHRPARSFLSSRLPLTGEIAPQDAEPFADHPKLDGCA